MDDPSELQVEANAVPSEQLRSAESRADAGPEPPGRSLLLVLTRCGVVALPSESIVEVLTAAPLARLPGARVEVAGVVNRRGTMLTVIDLGESIGCEAAAADPEHRVVVVEYEGREVGVAVNDVLQLTMERGGDGDAEEKLGRHERRPRVVELEQLLQSVFRSME